MLPRVLLLQARLEHDPMLEHEVQCFVRQSHLPRENFKSVNMTHEQLGPEHLHDIDVVMVGGSGEFSVVKSGFTWHVPMLEMMRTIVHANVPMFASCFGHQALAQALGGTIERDEVGIGEVGTFDIELTDTGVADPLFGKLPKRFKAQLGHLDQVVRLPENTVNLARSEMCGVQALRIKGTSIISTQFHPELTMNDQLERWLRYIANYKKADETLQEAEERARSLCHPSPVSSDLLYHYLTVELGYDIPASA